MKINKFETKDRKIQILTDVGIDWREEEIDIPEQEIN